MEHNEFKLHSDYAPTGDQPQAIEKLTLGFKQGNQFETVLPAPARPLRWRTSSSDCRSRH